VRGAPAQSDFLIDEKLKFGSVGRSSREQLMAKMLYIEASPRKKRSYSISTSSVFLNEYRRLHPQDEIVSLDLWKRELPRFDGDVIDAKYAILHGQSHTQEQAKAWKAVETTIAEFKSADKYVISLPMWNYSIPYKLKHYIDVLVQPGYTFSYSAKEGYKGLVTGKKILLIYARGGAYGAETGAQQFDLQTRYMETILQFIGFENFTSLLIEPTLSEDATQKEAVVKRAKEQALQLAATF
jgi:FMN-dependent NADH-azoreductase